MSVLTGERVERRRIFHQGRLEWVRLEGVGRLSNTVAEIASPMHDVGHQPTDSVGVRSVALGQFPDR